VSRDKLELDNLQNFSILVKNHDKLKSNSITGAVIIAIASLLIGAGIGYQLSSHNTPTPAIQSN
jgi:hypothetical protein